MTNAQSQEEMREYVLSHLEATDYDLGMIEEHMNPAEMALAREIVATQKRVEDELANGRY